MCWHRAGQSYLGLVAIEMIGPSKYDGICTMVRHMAGAEGVIVIIVNGDKGSGFSVQLNPLMSLAIPEILERIAKEIRESGGPLGGPLTT